MLFKKQVFIFIKKFILSLYRLFFVVKKNAHLLDFFRMHADSFSLYVCSTEKCYMEEEIKNTSLLPKVLKKADDTYRLP